MNLRDEAFFQGPLLFPPQGMLGQLKKTWHAKFCQIFKASKYGIERLEIYDAQEEVATQQHSPRIITLEACVKIAPGSQPKVFTVLTKTSVHHFGCYTDAETTDWIEAFQSVAFKGDKTERNIEEDNDLYCTSGEGVFSVKVVETEASRRCKLEAKSYTLVIAAADMKLLDGETPKYTWPYRYIRRYGYRDGKFTFEAGRMCESGEGSFRLEHSNQQEIFRCISAKMKFMKKLLNSDNSPSIIEFNEAQYHAALSMEAGSRSPLPPSPNSSGASGASNNLIDLDFSTISQNLQKQQQSLSFTSLETVPFAKPPPPIVKPKPAKPPRKSIFTGLLEKKSESEFAHDTTGVCRKLNRSSVGGDDDSPESSINRSLSRIRSSDDKQHPYDLVEVRSGAWKTHGLDNIPHTERIERGSYSSDELENQTTTTDLDEEAVEATHSVERNESSRYETINTHLVPIGNVCLPTIRKASLESASNSTIVTTAVTVATAASPIIHNNIIAKSDYPNYDKLQHFGSMHKLNNNSGYKTPNVSSHANSVVSPNETNDQWPNYDVVENLSAIRLADDTHNGYGIIRKKTSNRASGSTAPKHRVFNDSEYAVVSKPKRV